MRTDPNCVFCRIVAGGIPALKVFEDSATLAFLDIGPLAEGHLLVVPKAHYERLEEMPPDEAGRVMRHFPRLAKAVLQVARTDGYSVLQNNGKVAGQDVPHVHFHIIPRATGDGLGYRWNARKYPTARGEEIQKLLLDALSE